MGSDADDRPAEELIASPDDRPPEDILEAAEKTRDLSAESRFEEEPLTRPEYLSVMVHFYRAEVGRSTVWRQRLDATTNWAVLTSAGMLSFAFAQGSHSHILLLLSNLIILGYLSIEARRYQRFEVYRARVRMLEENFLSPIITRNLESPMEYWSAEVAKDLHQPTHKTTFLQAMGFRLRRNYAYIFGVLLGGWAVKLAMHPFPATSGDIVWQRMDVGPLPATMILAAGVAFYAALGWVMWMGRNIHGRDPSDEVAGLEPSPECWKF